MQIIAPCPCLWARLPKPPSPPIENFTTWCRSLLLYLTRYQWGNFFGDQPQHVFSPNHRSLIWRFAKFQIQLFFPQYRLLQIVPTIDSISKVYYHPKQLWLGDRQVLTHPVSLCLQHIQPLFLISFPSLQGLLPRVLVFLVLPPQILILCLRMQWTPKTNPAIKFEERKMQICLFYLLL